MTLARRRRDTRTAPASSYAERLAERIQEAHADLSARWLVALDAALVLAPDQIFPGRHLLDHIPELLLEIGGYLRAPASEEIAANTAVVDKARELGNMRYEQRASVHQLLREYQLLSGVLSEFIADESGHIGVEPSARECIAAMSRIERAVQILMQATIDAFIARYTETIREQTERLHSFNRTISHELRNPLNTVQLALKLVGAGAVSPEVGRWLDVMRRNVDHMAKLVNAVSELSRASAVPDTPAQQRIDVTTVASEVARQLEEMAAARGVEIVIDAGLPTFYVDAARLELILMNLVSNAIKYADPAKARRLVEIRAGDRGGEGMVMVVVSDNGLGIPREAIGRIFEGFFRAHADRDAALGNDGNGLGLAIVAECVRGIEGRIEVESEVGKGTTFLVYVPDRPEPSPVTA